MRSKDPDPLRFDWLSRQPPEFQAQVMRGARVLDRKAPEFVTHFGDTPTGLYGILDGAIGIHVPGPDGRSVLSHILRQGNWFGQTPPVADRLSSLSFSVLEDARLLYLSMAKAQEIMDKRPTGRGPSRPLPTLAWRLPSPPLARFRSATRRAALPQRCCALPPGQGRGNRCGSSSPRKTWARLRMPPAMWQTGR